MQRRFVHFHGASIGEVICAHRVYRELLARSPEEDYRFAFTYTSRYGRDWLAAQPASPSLWHERLGRKAKRRLRKEIASASDGASVLVILEKDRWPSLFRLHRASNAVLNIEAKPPQSKKNKVFERFIGKNLRKVTSFLVESEEYKSAIREYVPNVQVTVSGTLKAPRSQHRAPNLSGGNRVAFVSVHEEEIGRLGTILSEARGELGAVQALVIPRYVRAGRFRKSGRRFIGKATNTLPDVKLVRDTEELVDAYARADNCTAVYTEVGGVSEFLKVMDVTVVCGSLELGLKGHNFLEPLALGIPTVVGPHVRNWRWSVDEFSREGSLSSCEAGDIGAWLATVLGSEVEYREACDQVVRSEALKRHQGARVKVADAVLDALETDGNHC